MLKFAITTVCLFTLWMFSMAQKCEPLQKNEQEKLISNGTFIEGEVYTQTDTVYTNILSFKGKRKVNNHLYCITKNNSDSIVVYYPAKVSGYKIDNAYYKSHIKSTNHFFIKQLKSGKVDLFDLQAIAPDFNYLYYLKFQNRQELVVINPHDVNVSVYYLPDANSNSSGGTTPHYQSKGLPEKFKVFVSTYFKECSKVVNMVNGGLITINDIPYLVDIYNNCGCN